jgi:hypothetical protein
MKRVLPSIPPTAPFTPFAYLRIGTALVLLGKVIVEWNNALSLYGNEGLLPWPLKEIGLDTLHLRVSVLAELLRPLGLTEQTVVYSVLSIYVAALLGLLVGWASRLMAIAVWLIHLMLTNSGGLSAYGVDAFATISLFYCVLMPIGRAFSVDARRCPQDETAKEGRVFLTLVQGHLCLAYLSSGWEKALGLQWWNGEAIWQALLQPQFAHFDFSWLAYAPWLAVALCWATLVLETGYLFLMPLPHVRPFWLAGIISLHLSIAFLMQLGLFSALMIVLNLSAFGYPWLDRLFRRFPYLSENIPANAQ